MERAWALEMRSIIPGIVGNHIKFKNAIWRIKSNLRAFHAVRSLEYVSYVEAKSETRQYRGCKEVFGVCDVESTFMIQKRPNGLPFKTFTRKLIQVSCFDVL